MAGTARVPHRGATLVELVGPAGVGKSTLARALRSADPAVRIGPEIWGLPLSRLAAAALALVPTIVLAILEGHRPRSSELAQMIRLGALRRTVDREARRLDGVLVLDEGPLFGLAWLEVFGTPNDSASRARWRREVIAEWARRLDVVVRLEAGDRVLSQRIRRRSQRHLYQNRPDGALDHLAARYRAAFDQVVAETVRAAPVRVNEFRTDRSTPGEALAWLRQAIVEVPDGA